MHAPSDGAAPFAAEFAADLGPREALVPTVVSVGAGAAWTVDADSRTVSRVDLRTRTVETLSAGTVPLDIAAGPDAAWLVGGQQPRAGEVDYPRPDTLTRLDPVSGAVAEMTPGRVRCTVPIDPPSISLAGVAGERRRGTK